MNIIFVGGGSLGPVSPLLATAKALKRLEKSVKLSWIGTPNGPERALIELAGIPFQSVPVAKLPRYPSVRWITFPFDWLKAKNAAKKLIKELKPDAVVSVGGFTAVPVFIEASKRGAVCIAHQLDLKPTLSNRQIARLCASVTTSFEYERPPFGEWVSDQRIPTPVRFQASELPSRAIAAKHFGLDPNKPIVLVFGGGTGAQALNEHIVRTKDEWMKFTQLIHLTGKGKLNGAKSTSGYTVKELLVDDMHFAYAAADLAVTRAGFASLSEMTAALEMPSIVVPLPGTEQESNAKAFEERGGVVVIHQSNSHFDEEMLTTAKLFLEDPEGRKAMGEQAHDFLPTDDGTTLAKRILKALKRK